MAKAPADVQDLFKEEFKRYKKSSARDFIDFRTPDRFRNELTEFAAIVTACHSRFGLRPPHEWKLYRLQSIPGIVVVPNPFHPGGQLHWVARCLVDYPCKPNICNLDAHIVRSGDGRLWPEAYSVLTADHQAYICQVAGTEPKNVGVKRVKLSKDLDKDTDLYRLRWITLGYHYDWNTKEYNRERWSPFPKDLGEMATFILNVCGFSNFNAEAGIVNYYHMDSTLSGHTDHSEKDLAQPLLSLSFGQSAIFLIGGTTKQTRPKALLLNSGDIVIMSGDSRLAYHGVPKILPYCREGISNHQPNPSAICLSEGAFEARSTSACGFGLIGRTMDQSGTAKMSVDEAEKGGCPCCEELIKTRQLFESYISVSRINVNIRQVVSQNCTF